MIYSNNINMLNDGKGKEDSTAVYVPGEITLDQCTDPLEESDLEDTS